MKNFRSIKSSPSYIKEIPHEAASTFSQVGHREGNADDSHKIFDRNQGPQNGSDTDCFTFASMDQLT